MEHFRQFGGSSGAILEALGKAMQNPGTRIYINDKTMLSNSFGIKHAKRLKDKSVKIIKDLNLEDIEVYMESTKCLIISKFYGVKESLDGAGYKQATPEDWGIHNTLGK